MGDEYDLYGSDIYGGLTSTGVARAVDRDSHAIANYSTDLDLSSRPSDQHAKIKDLEARLEEYESIFRDGGSGLDGKQILDPRTMLAESKKSRAAEKQLQAEALALKQREQRLQMHLAERDLETVRQLLLDPAVAREFERLRRDCEAKAQEVKALQEELQAVGFSQESKAGRMLMAKCRALQDENEEMGRELAEGKVHGLEQQVALAKGFVEDLRSRYLELEDHTHTLDAEAEDLTRQVVTLKQQLKEAEGAASRGRGPPGSYPPQPPPRFNSKPPGSFTSPRGGASDWSGPPVGGRPSRHEGSLGDRKRPYEKEVRDERSHGSKRSSR